MDGLRLQTCIARKRFKKESTRQSIASVSDAISMQTRGFGKSFDLQLQIGNSHQIGTAGVQGMQLMDRNIFGIRLKMPVTSLVYDRVVLKSFHTSSYGWTTIIKSWQQVYLLQRSPQNTPSDVSMIAESQCRILKK